MHPIFTTGSRLGSETPPKHLAAVKLRDSLPVSKMTDRTLPSRLPLTNPTLQVAFPNKWLTEQPPPRPRPPGRGEPVAVFTSAGRGPRPPARHAHCGWSIRTERSRRSTSNLSLPRERRRRSSHGEGWRSSSAQSPAPTAAGRILILAPREILVPSVSEARQYGRARPIDVG